MTDKEEVERWESGFISFTRMSRTSFFGIFSKVLQKFVQLLLKLTKKYFSYFNWIFAQNVNSFDNSIEGQNQFYD